MDVPCVSGVYIVSVVFCFLPQDLRNNTSLWWTLAEACQLFGLQAGSLGVCCFSLGVAQVRHHAGGVEDYGPPATGGAGSRRGKGGMFIRRCGLAPANQLQEVFG